MLLIPNSTVTRAITRTNWLLTMYRLDYCSALLYADFCPLTTEKIIKSS